MFADKLCPAARRYQQWLNDGAKGSFCATLGDFPSGRFALSSMLFSGSWGCRFKQGWRCLCAYLGSLTPFNLWKKFWYRRAGVKIGNNVFLAPGVVLDMIMPQLITIEDEAVLGMGSMINAHLYTPNKVFVGRVRVGRFAVIGARSMVGNSVSIGDNAIVGSLSFVFNCVVPENSLALGVPAVIKHKDMPVKDADNNNDSVSVE